MLRYRRLVYRFKDRVYAFAFHYLGNREDAEEVTQDVLLRLWHHYRTLDDELLSNWIMRVSRNLCIDYLRKNRAREARVVSDSKVSVLRDAATMDMSPDAKLSEKELRQKLQKAMEALPEPQRSIVQLREIHAVSYQEISAALDLPLNTVKVYLHRARRVLREQLSQQWHHEYQ